MMFEQAYTRTHGFEVGFANNKDDRGGKTMHGVTESTWLDYWENKPPYPIEKATPADCKQVLKTLYWLKPKVDKIAEAGSVTIAAHVFDACVNHGQRRGVMLLQTACNMLGSKLVVDGIVGPLTLAEVKMYEAKYRNSLVGMFVYERGRLYESIGSNNPSQKKFYKSWYRRLV